MDEPHYTAVLGSRLGVLKAKSLLAERVKRHADYVVRHCGEGAMTREEAVCELEWLNDYGHLKIGGMTGRAGASLPHDGTGVMQY